MKIAIHHREGSFSEYWIKYCHENNIDHKIVNAYDNDIMAQLADCDSFMWHYSNYNYRDMIMAQHILYAMQEKGKRTFPNFNTSWHFDDKVAQKYLLESVNAPLIPSYVFYDKDEAMRWCKNVSYPIVSKLRKGAGSINVKLVNNFRSAKKIVKKSFGRGIPQMSFSRYFIDRVNKFLRGRETISGVGKGLLRIFIKNEYYKMSHHERGYVYFQKYIPDLSYDIRVIVIYDKAIAIKRMVRENDFRASGSGLILYEKKHFKKEVISTAFKVADQLKSQCMAFDFIYEGTNPRIVEISYGFVPSGYISCEGYWDKDLVWYPKPFNIYGWMVDGVIA